MNSERTTGRAGLPGIWKRRRGLILFLGAVAAVLVAAGFWYLTQPVPEEVDIAATAQAVGAGDLTGESSDGIDGSWIVDTSIGDFSVDDPTSTFVGFRVDEELTTLGSVTAVGRTPDVTGELVVDGTTLTSAEFTVDFTTIVSDQSRREDSIQDALNTTTHPTASFSLTVPVDLGEGLELGELVMIQATGVMTINGVTNQVDLPMELQMVNGSVLIVGSMDIVFADHGVGTPTARIVLSVEDFGIVEVQLWLTRSV